MATIIPDSALGDRAYGINAGEKYLLNKLKAALPDDCLIGSGAKTETFSASAKPWPNIVLIVLKFIKERRHG